MQPALVQDGYRRASLAPRGQPSSMYRLASIWMTRKGFDESPLRSSAWLLPVTLSSWLLRLSRLTYSSRMQPRTGADHPHPPRRVRLGGHAVLRSDAAALQPCPRHVVEARERGVDLCDPRHPGRHRRLHVQGRWAHPSGHERAAPAGTHGTRGEDTRHFPCHRAALLRAGLDLDDTADAELFVMGHGRPRCRRVHRRAGALGAGSAPLTPRIAVSGLQFPHPAPSI